MAGWAVAARDNVRALLRLVGGAPGYRHWNGGDLSRPDPANNITAVSYPQLGPYDSTNLHGTIAQHMQWFHQASVDVLIVSWWGQSSYEDNATAAVMQAAAVSGLRVCVQIEPYAGRTPASTVSDVAYLYNRYGGSPAFYRAFRPTLNGPSGQARGLILAYAPTGAGWSTALNGIRGTANDAIVLVRTDDSKLYSDADVRGQIGWTGADGLYNYGYYASPERTTPCSRGRRIASSCTRLPLDSITLARPG